MPKIRKIQINNAVMAEFLRLVKTDEALEMIKSSFTLQDMKDSIKFIYEKRNFTTNDRMERFLNTKAHLEIPDEN